MEERKISNLTILKGVLIGLLILVIISIVLAIIFSLFASLNMNSLNSILLGISLVTIIYIGFFTGKRIKYYGWLHGSLGGMIFMIIIILLGSISVTITLGNIFLLLLLGIFLGGIGGVIGINF